ncbi:MAG: NRDE family protein [Alphaproteobacteria bacterium]|nr:NRDE family protein [Alphaproteobacteria bacterium]
MCTVVVLFRPGHAWPLILAANRDEMIDRPWRAPGRHWPDRPRVVAGQDQLAGGTWLGRNDEGVVAGILNRPGSLGPEKGKRSRGELPLAALDRADARAAADALARVDPGAYRTFNMVVADRRSAFWLRRADETDMIESFPIPEGLSMITAHDRNDSASARIRYYLPLFAEATPPDPGADDWADWRALLASGETAPGAGPREAMFIAPDRGYGTVSSSLVALPANAAAPIWLFAPGFPNPAPFAPVTA